MIKEIIFKYECSSCGSELFVKRIIQIDGYLNSIKVFKPRRCKCGRKKGFKLIDMKLIDIEVNKKNENN